MDMAGSEGGDGTREGCSVADELCLSLWLWLMAVCLSLWLWLQEYAGSVVILKASDLKEVARVQVRLATPMASPI